MSQLPEWLWPVEDEEAVQEAERLIEETHNTLRKMEADMQVQRTLSLHLSSKTDKLKSSMNERIHTLENELKSLSYSKDSTSTYDKQPKQNKVMPMKQIQIEGSCPNEQKVMIRNTLSETNADPGLSGSQQPHQSNRKPKCNSNSAERVVISAREKVQDALAMARHVSASLDQHVSTTFHQNKPLSVSQVTNVGIFEVKSQADEIKTQNRKPRLQQALLPSVSIKRGLEKQSILSIQVPPGEKTVTPNVSVFSIKHDKVTIPEDQPSQQKTCKEIENTSNQDKENIKCATDDLNLKTTLAQLSKQLMEVEELREINQTQVNHVLRYLLSRVCSDSQAQGRTKITPEEPSKIETKEIPVSPISSSASESSKCPIAYDSLSRFLETYKNAAEHNMLVQKRATERRRKELSKQKKEIQQSRNANENHLLIGPLRQAVELQLGDTHKSVPEYHSATSGSYQSDGHGEYKSSAKNSSEDISINKGTPTFPFKIPSCKSSSSLDSPQEKSGKNSSQDTSLPITKVPSGGISHDEYEDDWEEEEDHNGLQNSDLELNMDKTPLKNSEQLQPVSDSDLIKPPQPGLKSLEMETLSLNLNLLTPLIADNEKSQSVDESPVRHEEADTVDNNKLSYLSQDKNSVVREELKELQINTTGSDLDKSHLGVPVHSSHLVHEIRDSDKGKATNISLMKETEAKQPHDESKTKPPHGMRKRSQARLLSSCSSSSDAEINYEPRRPPRSFKRWDLNLREDLQLQSAILLNWQLENRWKTKNCDSDTKDHPTLVSHKDQVITDVEKRWQKTLAELDVRVKTIEENERINRIASEIKNQVREEQSKIVTQTKVSEDTGTRDKIASSAAKVVMMDQTVQTSPIKPVMSQDKVLPRKHNQFTLPNHSLPLVLQDFKTLSTLKRHLPSSYDNDLTSELLAYGRMGILPTGQLETNIRKSPTSSSTSSHLLQSTIAVSLSDGELRSSASESCSCSEGEFCVCGGRKRCSERAPPDGSQTFSDGENFLRDVSQGEILPSKVNKIIDVLKDTSFGEITSHATGDFPSEGLDLVESEDTEELDWDLR